MPEHGLQPENTKKCTALPSAECFVSSFRQRKRKNKEDLDGTDIQNEEMNEDTQEEEDSTNDEYDQDSSISFEDDADGTTSQEDELEDWVEYMK